MKSLLKNFFLDPLLKIITVNQNNPLNYYFSNYLTPNIFNNFSNCKIMIFQISQYIFFFYFPNCSI